MLRIGFGALWLFDGLLQAQPQMAGGLPGQVMQPAADGSPSWVVSLVNFGANVWNYHPIAAAASSVWIQVGIGLWLIFAVRGWSIRLAALSSVAWGLVVWAFGEAFGAIFAPGLTVLFGAPGAVLIYAVAGGTAHAARADLGAAVDRPSDTRRNRGLPPWHGAAAGVARARLLAGQAGRRAGLAGGDGPDDGEHPAAARA